MKGSELFDKEKSHFNLARLTKTGEKFEVVIDPDAAVAYKAGSLTDVRDALKSEKVFSDAKKGLVAPDSSMERAFSTTDALKVAEIIISKGDIQLTSQYRDSLRDVKKKQLIELIHRNAIDPKTNLPHPATRLENAFAEAKVKIDEHKKAEDQLEDVLKQLRPILPIRFETRKLQILVPLAFAYVGDIAPKKQEGKYLGTITMSMFLGFGIGPVIGGTLNHVYNMNAAFVIMGILGLVALVLVFVMLPELGIYKTKKPTAYIKIIRDKTMQTVLLIRLTTAFGVAGFMVFLPLYAVTLGMNTAQIGGIVTLNLLVTALPQIYFGKLADRHNKVLMITIGNLILAGSILLIPITWNFTSLLALNLVMGLGGAIAIPANTALGAELGRMYGMGSVMGLMQTAFALGLTAGPLIAGVILDLAGISMVFVHTAILVGTGTVIYYFLANQKNQKAGVST